jgi:citrate lyase subunit beta/citryl-CoA lyase
MRSLLFVPGDSEKKLAKAIDSGTDVLILDLEDSVAPDRKSAARDLTRAFLTAHRPAMPRPRLYVRINPMTTDLWQDDLAGVMPAAPDGVVLPKPRSGEDVHRLSVALVHGEERAGLVAHATRIIPIVTEVPVSVLQLPSYVGASERLEGLTWGAEDLSAEIGSVETREADGSLTPLYRLVRDLTLVTAAAAGVAAIDTVFVSFRDSAGLERECRAAARDGFTAKLAIHPDQVAVINAAFTPGEEEVARAREIVRLFADSPGAGVVSLGGQMLDRPHLKRAERVLARSASGMAGAARS